MPSESIRKKTTRNQLPYVILIMTEIDFQSQRIGDGNK